MQKRVVVLTGAAALAAAALLPPDSAGIGLAVALALSALSAGSAAASVLGHLLRVRAEGDGAVLRGARARLHAVDGAPPPKPEFDDVFEDLCMSRDDAAALEVAPLVWRYVDVTIELPDSDDGGRPRPVTLWEPGALRLVEPGATSGRPTDAFDDAIGTVHAVDVMQGGGWVPLDGDQVVGSQRVRIHAGVPEGTDAFKLRYGCEILKNAGPH